MCREDAPSINSVLMMGQEQYCLKWNHHWLNLIGVFNSLLQSETFVDVTLACEGQTIKAHRLILSACSPYFTRLLLDSPDRHPVIIVKGTSYAHLKALIHFIYNGEVAVEQKELPELIAIARELQVRGLADNCLNGEQLKFAAAQSLSKAEKDGATTTRPVSAEEASSEEASGAFPPKILTGGAFATPVSSIPPPSSVRMATDAADGRTDSNRDAAGMDGSSLGSHSGSPVVVSEPLSLLVSSDQPTDLTSTSKQNPPQQQRSAPDNLSSTSSAAVGDSSSACSSSSTGGGNRRSESPLRKRRRLSEEGLTGVNGSNDHNTPPACYEAASSRTTPLSESNGSLAVSNTDLHNEDEPLALTVDCSRSAGVLPEQRSPLQLTASDRRTPSRYSAAAAAREDDNKPAIHTPEMMLKDESEYMSGNHSASSSPVHPPSGSSVTGLPHPSPLLPATPSAPLNRHHLALLHRALSVGYSHVPYFPPGLEPPHGSVPPSIPAVTNQTKDILQFLDLVKTLGSAESALAAAGLSPGFPGIPGVAPSGPLSPSKEGEASEYTCHICARIMPSQHFLEEHIKIHEEEKPYKCDHCGQRYKYQSAFQRHQEQNHTAKLPGEKPYRCTVCGQCFKYHKSFLKHRSNHDVLDHIMKNECGEEGKGGIHPAYIHSLLNSRLNLQQGLSHLHDGNAAHGGCKEEMVDVDDSSADVPSTPNAAGPENGKLKEEDDDTEDVEESSSVSGKRVQCFKCYNTFKDSASFDAHCQMPNSECSVEFKREVSIPTDNSNMSNPHSGSSSPPASPHQSPMWTSSSLSRSPLAGAAASSPQLTTPVNILSPSSATTATTSILNSLTHINFRNFASPGAVTKIPCSISPIIAASVGAATASSSKADDTMATMPVDEERPFKCPYCTKGFKGRENLKLHIRTHTGEKPYNCGVCGKAFGGRSDMNRHLRIHTGEKPYPCKVCGKKFARADYLSKHITTHLGIPFSKPVHSLQQSLQNLENIQSMQNVQNLQKLNNVQSN